LGRLSVHEPNGGEQTKTVVVTGASAGIGRATAVAFGALGNRVALLARGQSGLHAASEQVIRVGGQAMPLAVDVADFAAVDQAAANIEQRFGAIDVWVNNAFASVFAPFWNISPDEYRRVTEVAYLGFVHGTMAALARMRPRDRGVIVQVGSALGERSIPLQSAYCGAKHAINGFTSSLRVELRHDASRVQVTAVQMPAVNTPQFSWVRTRLPRHPRPVAPIYQPEVAARAVVFASEHPDARQFWVGGSTVATILANRAFPGLLDRYLAHTGYDSQQTDQSVASDRPDNLFVALDESDSTPFGSRGAFDTEAKDRSPQLWLAQQARRLSRALTDRAGGTRR
jgi:NAD(P)-dependent dehydrogenase (short-subunit alcohol dehydrogenase family)